MERFRVPDDSGYGLTLDRLRKGDDAVPDRVLSAEEACPPTRGSSISSRSDGESWSNSVPPKKLIRDSQVAGRQGSPPPGTDRSGGGPPTWVHDNGCFGDKYC